MPCLYGSEKNHVIEFSFLSTEEVIKQSLIFLLPAFESDISHNFRLNLAKFSLLNDIQLWKTANSAMNDSQQLRLEELAELQKHRSLMEQAYRIMLCRAEARQIPAQRGHTKQKTN